VTLRAAAVARGRRRRFLLWDVVGSSVGTAAMLPDGEEAAGPGSTAGPFVCVSRSSPSARSDPGMRVRATASATVTGRRRPRPVFRQDGRSHLRAPAGGTGLHRRRRRFGRRFACSRGRPVEPRRHGLAGGLEPEPKNNYYPVVPFRLRLRHDSPRRRVRGGFRDEPGRRQYLARGR